MKNRVIFSLKALSPTKFIARQCIVLHSGLGLTLNHALSLGHGFSSIKVLPTPDERAQQRNKGTAKIHTKSLVSNIPIEGKRWEELCMTGNEMARSDCFGGGFLVCCFCYTNHASHVVLSSVLLELSHPNSFGRCGSST